VATIDALVLTFLLNALWQVPALAAAALLGARLLRRAPARHRFTLWLAAFLLGAVLPWTSLLPAHRRAEAPPPAGVAQPARSAPGVTAREGPLPVGGRQPASLPAPLAAGLAFVYGGTVLFQAARLVRACRRTQRIARSARLLELPPEASAIAERCRAAFGLSGVSLLVSEEVTGPVTLGVLRPRILFPPSFVADASAEQLTAALGHEMAHIRRRDYAVHLLCEALFVPVAFHPAACRVRRRLAETRELACDEAAVERLMSARCYARSLLSMAAAIAGLARPAHTLGVLDADTLEVRMKSLTNPGSRLGARPAHASLAAALLLLAGLGLAASTVAVDAATVTATPTADAVKPFLGLWRGTFPGDDGKLPGLDLKVRTANGRPEAILTMYRHRKQPDGSVRTDAHDVPVSDLKITARTLSYHTRYVLQFKEGGRKEILDNGSRLELTGDSQGVLTFVEPASRRKDLPPPPPPIPMQRQR
jgi:beta-lactamase regulating signal transducer with metallopeptidase domain